MFLQSDRWWPWREQSVPSLALAVPSTNDPAETIARNRCAAKKTPFVAPRSRRCRRELRSLPGPGRLAIVFRIGRQRLFAYRPRLGTDRLTWDGLPPPNHQQRSGRRLPFSHEQATATKVLAARARPGPCTGVGEHELTSSRFWPPLFCLFPTPRTYQYVVLDQPGLLEHPALNVPAEPSHQNRFRLALVTVQKDRRLSLRFPAFPPATILVRCTPRARWRTPFFAAVGARPDPSAHSFGRKIVVVRRPLQPVCFASVALLRGYAPLWSPTNGPSGV